MCANGDQRSFSCQIAVQLVLQINEGVVSGLVELDAAKDGSGEVRANLRDLCVWEPKWVREKQDANEEALSLR